MVEEKMDKIKSLVEEARRENKICVGIDIDVSGNHLRKKESLPSGVYAFHINTIDETIAVPVLEFKPRCCEHPSCENYLHFSFTMDNKMDSIMGMLCFMCSHFKLRVDFSKSFEALKKVEKDFKESKPEVEV